MTTELPFQTLLSIIDTAVQRINPETDRESCVGQTQKHRRCTRLVSCSSHIEATSLIRQLPLLVDDPQRLSDGLLELAELTLCRKDYQDQAEKIAQEWLRKIRLEVDGQRAVPARPASSDGSHVAPGNVPDNEPDDSSSATRSDAESLWESDWASDAGGDVGVDAASDVESDDGSLWQSDWESDTGGDSGVVAEDGAEDHESNNPAGIGAEDEICPICHQSFTDPVQTPCEHRFCRGCLAEWQQNNNTCPFDRLPLEATELVTVVLNCAICLEECNAACETPCGHTFCRGCITTWAVLRGQCPMDRRWLGVEDLVDVHQ